MPASGAKRVVIAAIAALAGAALWWRKHPRAPSSGSAGWGGRNRPTPVLIASVVLLLYMQTLGALADLAGTTGDLEALCDPSPLLHSAAALALLLAAAALSVFKPAGRTRYGWRRAVGVTS